MRLDLLINGTEEVYIKLSDLFLLFQGIPKYTNVSFVRSFDFTVYINSIKSHLSEPNGAR